MKNPHLIHGMLCVLDMGYGIQDTGYRIRFVDKVNGTEIVCVYQNLIL